MGLATDPRPSRAAPADRAAEGGLRHSRRRMAARSVAVLGRGPAVAVAAGGRRSARSHAHPADLGRASLGAPRLDLPTVDYPDAAGLARRAAMKLLVLSRYDRLGASSRLRMPIATAARDLRCLRQLLRAG